MALDQVFLVQVYYMDVKFGIEIGQIGTTWDKSGTFQYRISFSTFWLTEPKCTETDLKKSQICPIWGHSDPIWKANLTSLVYKAKLVTLCTMQAGQIMA